jgi:hypothetical protein
MLIMCVYYRNSILTIKNDLESLLEKCNLGNPESEIPSCHPVLVFFEYELFIWTTKGTEWQSKGQFLIIMIKFYSFL